MTCRTSEHGRISATAADVIALLDEMLRLYERAATMGGLAVTIEDGESVLETLRQRAGVVEELRQRDARLAVLRERMSTSCPGPEDRAAVERKLGAVAAAARRLAGVDEALRARLAGRRDELADELATTGRGSAANAAYGRRGHAEPRLQDTEG